MHLTKTLEMLIEQGTLVLATSNYAPGELMPNPLFHDRFLPAIALIESRFEVIPLGDGPDYRKTTADRGHTGFRAGHWDIDPEAATAPLSRIDLTVNGLTVRAVSVHSDATTFTFAQLCEQPLGIREYLRLTEDFDRIRLIAVPDLASAERESIMRLCILIEVLYDRDQELEVQADAAPQRMLEAKEPPMTQPALCPASQHCHPPRHPVPVWGHDNAGVVQR